MKDFTRKFGILWLSIDCNIGLDQTRIQHVIDSRINGPFALDLFYRIDFSPCKLRSGDSKTLERLISKTTFTSICTPPKEKSQFAHTSQRSKGFTPGTYKVETSGNSRSSKPFIFNFLSTHNTRLKLTFDKCTGYERPVILLTFMLWRVPTDLTTMSHSHT